jgi:serine protease inhibitor
MFDLTAITLREIARRMDHYIITGNTQAPSKHPTATPGKLYSKHVHIGVAATSFAKAVEIAQKAYPGLEIKNVTHQGFIELMEPV